MLSPNRRLTIARVAGEPAVRDWLAVPHAVFAGDPAWIPPLNFQERRRISPRHSPFFTFGEAEFFIAYRGEVPVGRISAQVNRRHLDRYGDATGQFGFFDCLDDQDAAQGLIATAAAWLRERGLKRMTGPMNFSLNEECGCLVSGFETPPALLMTHARPWTGRLLENCGLAKEIDLFAYRYIPASLPARIDGILARADRSAGLSLRPFAMNRYQEEVRTLVDIFNDAWSANWGFVPLSPPEVDALIAEMRPFFKGQYGRFAMLHDEPVGFMVEIPDLNDVIASFGGRLAPFNWMKLLWAMKWGAARTARIPLLGLKRTFQSTPIAGIALAMLFRDFSALESSYPHDWVEFSWILETNRRMVALAEAVAGPPAKIYRIYGRNL
jgi:hypothetical protein